MVGECRVVADWVSVVAVLVRSAKEFEAGFEAWGLELGYGKSKGVDVVGG